MRSPSRIERSREWEAQTKRWCGKLRGPHSHAGQKTPTRSDFMVPGGTLMSNLL